MYATNENFLVKAPAKDTSSGGIILTADEDVIDGEIIDIGGGVDEAIDDTVGFRIKFPKKLAEEFTHNGERYFRVHQNVVCMVYKPSAE